MRNKKTLETLLVRWQVFTDVDPADSFGAEAPESVPPPRDRDAWVHQTALMVAFLFALGALAILALRVLTDAGYLRPSDHSRATWSDDSYASRPFVPASPPSSSATLSRDSC